ncbi:hypothetical protein [Fimbriiglobus ruber]|uniref:Uncharacterized protein n=1 Tax=Fimbriiglobus ruber TaxID=1908690 RepID=A0A225DKM8_9BACT|nr:hypothetical protein [Fimbriiglobus ruber]OWK36707.1 hypothetical protein FRUB_09270 [Fimbriiglobus ruber]
MAEPNSGDWLPSDMIGRIVEEILAWNGEYPLSWSSELTEDLRDPAVFKTYLATHAVLWGASPELAATEPPRPKNPERG